MNTVAMPEVHLQVNNSGAWRTLTVVGLNGMERCREAVDVLCLADNRTALGKRPNYRLAIAGQAGFEVLEYRDATRGWYQA
jgi:hypothetical protein